MIQLMHLKAWKNVLGMGLLILGVSACGGQRSGSENSSSSHLQGQVNSLSNENPILTLWGVDSREGHRCRLQILGTKGEIHDSQHYRVRVQAVFSMTSCPSGHHTSHGHSHPDSQCPTGHGHHHDDDDDSSHADAATNPSCHNPSSHGHGFENIQYTPVFELAWSADTLLGSLSEGQSLRLYSVAGALSLKEATSFRANWWSEGKFYGRECGQLIHSRF